MRTIHPSTLTGRPAPVKILLSLAIGIFFMNAVQAQTERATWSKEKAAEWYSRRAWLSGSNYIPATAINQLEMWQESSFDPITINRELGYAQSIGFNTMRVFLHHLAWQTDPAGFKKRMNVFLDICAKHHIAPMFVFFDDCWSETYKAGPQPAPKPGVHNSGWIRDPGKLLYDDPTLIALLEKYVKDILTTFKHDKRILLWDLYNEPGNSDYGDKSLALLQKVFIWARQVNPDQPLSAGLWTPDQPHINRFLLDHDDVITYHNYDPEQAHAKAIDSLEKFGRPLICTEYMARTRNSKFANIMPLLRNRNVAAINWGFVSGKTNTIYAWDAPMPGGAEPKVWFHDIFRKDGTPYSKEEIALIKSMTGKK